MSRLLLRIPLNSRLPLHRHASVFHLFPSTSRTRHTSSTPPSSSSSSSSSPPASSSSSSTSPTDNPASDVKEDDAPPPSPNDVVDNSTISLLSALGPNVRDLRKDDINTVLESFRTSDSGEGVALASEKVASEEIVIPNPTAGSPPPSAPASSKSRHSKSSSVKEGRERERTFPIPLSELADSSIPILTSLTSRIQVPQNISPSSSTNVDSIHTSNLYPFHPATRAELKSVTSTLLVPSAIKTPAAQKSKTAETSKEKIPSMGSGIVVLSSPFRGSEKYLRALVESLAGEMNTFFLSLSSSDLFPRLSGYQVTSAPPIRGASQSSSNSDGNNPPWAAGPRGRGRAMGGTGMPKVGILNIGVNNSGGMIFGGPQSESGQVEAEEDEPFVPYPWYKPYTNKGKPMSLINPRITPIEPKGEPSSLITNTFETLFSTLTADPKLSPSQPLIIYYEDFIQLLQSPALTLQDTLSSFQQALHKARLIAPIVVITPSTPTFAQRRQGGNRGGGIEQAIMSAFGGNDEDGNGGAHDDEDSNIFGSGGGGGGPESGHPLSSGMERRHKKPKPVRFDTILDEWIGVPIVNVFPPLDKDGLRKFRDTMRTDCKEVYRTVNAREIEIVAKAANVDLGVESSTRVDEYVNAHPKIAGLLEERLLTMPEVEKIVFMAASSTEVTSTPPLRSALHTFNSTHHAQAILAGGVEFSGLFQNPRDRLRLSQNEEKILSTCYISSSSSSTTFNSIGGLSKTKQTIDELIRLPLRRPELFSVGILKQSTTGILLFGPPGTGKTLLCRAVAAESGANFLSVTMSSLSSMWVGENERNVKALFSLARKMRPAIIFVDEIDALLRARGRNQPSYVTSTLNEFMSEWDGMLSEQNNGVIVVGATNRPFDLDEAVLRRLPRRILVNLPDESERAEILNVLLKDETVCSEEGMGEEEDRQKIVKAVAKRTHEFSGSDLKNLCIAAALNALREQLLPTVSSTSSTPPPSLPPQAGSTQRILYLSHFYRVIDTGEIVPSLSDRAELTKQLEDWNRLYGTGSAGYMRGAGSGWGFKTQDHDGGEGQATSL